MSLLNKYVFQTNINLGYWTDYTEHDDFESAEKNLKWFHISGYPKDMLRIIKRTTIEEILLEYSN